MEDPVEVVFGNEPEVGKSEEAEDKVISNTIEPSSSPAPPPPPAPSVREVENLDDESQFGPTSTISRPIAAPRNQEKTTRKRCRYFCLFVLVVLLLLLVGILVWVFVFFNAKQSSNPIATCNGCYCIVAEGEKCPEPVPVNNFSTVMINNLQTQKPVNAYQLGCNPYESSTCQTQPPQNDTLLALGETAVCAIHYQSNSTQNGCVGVSYKLVTYPSKQDAEAAGGFVTHAGHCGVCSTMQDLAVYLQSPDLTTPGKFCGKEVLLGWKNGIQCYRNLGMTQGCAEIWAADSWNTATNCWKECIPGQTQANNGPPPNCTLNSCLQCDETKSGPIFKMVGGRTRERSGLLSAIVRPCSQFVNITQQECPVTLPYNTTMG